jgi:hypothetical protein
VEFPVPDQVPPVGSGYGVVELQTLKSGPPLA